MQAHRAPQAARRAAGAVPVKAGRAPPGLWLGRGRGAHSAAAAPPAPVTRRSLSLLRPAAQFLSGAVGVRAVAFVSGDGDNDDDNGIVKVSMASACLLHGKWGSSGGGGV